MLMLGVSGRQAVQAVQSARKAEVIFNTSIICSCVTNRSVPR